MSRQYFLENEKKPAKEQKKKEKKVEKGKKKEVGLRKGVSYEGLKKDIPQVVTTAKLDEKGVSAFF